jgi:hypothetical protein
MRVVPRVWRLLLGVPAVFLEAGNMRSAADVVLVTDPEFQNFIADAPRGCPGLIFGGLNPLDIRAF